MNPAEPTLPTVADLAGWQCRPDVARLSAEDLGPLLGVLPQWAHAGDRITREFRFASYDETMAFVNALAWIARRADHHPDVSVHYRHCVVSFTTHDAGGITRNDLACAATAELLVA